MKIVIASDHGGYELKQFLIDTFKKEGYDFVDYGTDSADSVDYPDYAIKVGEAVAAGEFDKITELTKEAVMTMLGFELKHIGINCENEEEAEKTAGTFASLFGFEKKSGNSSVFAGSAVEAMKSPYLGAKGHIAVGTNSVDRAVNYLESQGVEFNMDSAKYKDGKLTAIYLKEEVAGFAVHLVQK